MKVCSVKPEMALGVVKNAAAHCIRSGLMATQISAYRRPDSCCRSQSGNGEDLFLLFVISNFRDS